MFETIATAASLTVVAGLVFMIYRMIKSIVDTYPSHMN